MNQSTWFLLSIAIALFWSVSSPAQIAGRSTKKTLPEVFSVTPAGDSAILVNRRTGQSWWLHSSDDLDRPVWLPISRFDDFQQAAEWLTAQATGVNAKPAAEVQLAYARAQLKKLRSEYGSRHPRVVKIRESIRSLEKLATKRN